MFKSSSFLNLVVYKYKLSYFKGVYVRNTLAVIKTASTKMIKLLFNLFEGLLEKKELDLQEHVASATKIHQQLSLVQEEFSKSKLSIILRSPIKEP